MTEHLSPGTIELLIGRRLAPADLLAATRHIAGCVQCRQMVSDASDVNGRMQQLRAGLQSETEVSIHPGYEQIEAYVDESLAVKDREDVKRHLASCTACMNEVSELESLRDHLHSYPTVSGGAAAPIRQSESYWQRLAAVLQLRPRQLAFLTAALVLIAVVAVWLIRRPAPQQIVNKNSEPGNSNTLNQNEQLVGTNTNAVNGNQSITNDESEVVAASSYEGVIKQAMETQKITRAAALRDLTGKESSLLGSSEKQDRFALISPVATIVRSNRPVFRWHGLSGATAYSVAILDLNLNLIEKSSAAAKLSWAPIHPLKRNVIYLWQVTALKDGREIVAPAAPDREARFKTLSSARAASLSRSSEELAGSHLKLGIIYAHEGLLDDAESEFRAAIASGPDAALARKLLQSTRQMRN